LALNPPIKAAKAEKLERFAVVSPYEARKFAKKVVSQQLK